MISAWSEVAKLLPWSETEATKLTPAMLTPAMKMTGLRLRRCRADEGATKLLQAMKQMVNENPPRCPVAVSLRSRIAQSDPRQLNERRCAILKRVAIGSSNRATPTSATLAGNPLAQRAWRKSRRGGNSRAHSLEPDH